MAPKIEEESRKVFDCFKAEATSNDVLSFYLFNTQYPNFRESLLVKRATSFHEERERQKYMDSIIPETAHKNILKSFIGMMGSENAKTVGELEKQTRDEYRTL